MWGELPYLKDLLSSKKYNQAAKHMKTAITEGIQKGEHTEIIRFLRHEMLLLNTSSDSNQTSLFCNQLMKHCLDHGLDIIEYAEQCKILNEELDWYGEQYNQIVREMHALDPITALHVILATFENLNQYLLSNKPDDLERIFYSSYVYGMEADYESGITALNVLLKLWINSCHSERFRGRFKELPYVAEGFKDLRTKLAPIIRSLNYLNWLCKEVSLHHVTMNIQVSEVIFTIHDKSEYIHYKLPFIRDTARMQNALYHFPSIKGRFNWKKEEIDYAKIIQIKESGDDFKLKFGDDTFFEALKQSTELAYQSYLLIIGDMYIHNLHQLKIKDKSVSVMELFFFYNLIRTMGLIYFEATKHFMETIKKEARAPYLIINKKEIAELFSPILSKLFKREFTQLDVNQMIALLTFGSNDIFDLYYKPLIVSGNNVALIPSLFMMNNFAKTFLHHMNALGVNLSDRGDDFEKVMRERFSNNGFKVYPEQWPYAYKYEGKTIKGDIDLIAKKGKYLYLGQLKNRLEPLEPKDYRGADKKINQGISQAEQSELYVKRNQEEFCANFGITLEELDELIIKPFVLVSCFYGSGQVIHNIPVTDASALTRFFDEGEIRAYRGQNEPYSRTLRTTGEVLPNEFNAFLLKPYFLEEEIYGIQLGTHHAYPIRDRKFVLGLDDDLEKLIANSFMAKAYEHFEKVGANTMEDKN
ncbi:hypothetical protein FHS16_002240 [Paenibacillus endophyticus]|uniref:NERD domain-containing protein n=1 Tax=Paenibacillus endophyticus TaxID=1294268 RepID=A0A7W5C8Q2_9BACL|nr:hypothetical protein [Paenibacillus endophyticus]MBB3152194.1 hypothetical protein [Paenibacillus endophyticus]